MPQGFWKKLPKPFFALAPMANVTDAAFRKIIAKYGKPDVFWTEFVSSDGLCSTGRENLLSDLKFSQKERPIVAQFFGSKPENFYECARLARKLGFDGIDINMGCPDRAVVRQGAGAALINNPKLARKIIVETKRGARYLPVSVKTRIGDNRNIIGEWIKVLLKAEPAAIIIHARTRKEMSRVPAHWDAVREAVQIARKLKSKTLIIGNGDVSSILDARKRASETGADGIMIGRAVFGNPWFFDEKVDASAISVKKKLLVLAEHARAFERLLGRRKSFDNMKKHFKAYVRDFDGAKDLRMKLMESENAKAVEQIIKNHLRGRAGRQNVKVI